MLLRMFLRKEIDRQTHHKLQGFEGVGSLLTVAYQLLAPAPSTEPESSPSSVSGFELAQLAPLHPLHATVHSSPFLLQEQLLVLQSPTLQVHLIILSNC